ncbi:MAG: hypothetical protein AAGJ50_11725, partial [Pseudomonadota bacterium]
IINCVHRKINSSERGDLDMAKYMVGLIGISVLAGTQAFAQEDRSSATDPVFKPEAVLIDDPAPVEPEFSEAQGAAETEIMTPEELADEAEMAAALDGDMAGDIAAMPEVLDEPGWE